MREPVSQAQPHGSVTASATHSGGNRRSLWVSMAIAFVAVMILEVGFFNLGHWRTSRLQAATVGDAIIGEGLKSLGHHEYEITDPETATITVPVGARDSGAPVRIGSVRVQATPGNTNEVPNQRNHYSRAAIQLNTTGGQTISGNTWVDSRDSDGVWEDRLNILDYTTNPASQYLIFGKKLQYYDSHEIRVRYLGDKGDFVLFDSIHANPVIPFEINPWRLLVELAFAAFFVLFRPRSGIYRMRVDERRVRQNLAIAGYVVAWSAIIVAIARFAMPKPSGLNTGFMHWVDYEQYQRLADALIHGHTWLDLKVDPALTTMANPYDYFARRSIAADGTHTFYWDHAYYNGHYYCYFGVVPALLTFVPFQLVTGHWMPTWAAMGVFTTLAVVFGTLLVRRLARDYFPKASLGVVWLVIIGFNVATNLFVYVYSPNFYGMPINCSIAVTLVGLWFWQVSKRPDGTVNPWLIAAGSLCMALNFGSRPQFMAAWLLAFPLFWPQITKLRTLFSRKGLA
nr:glycosyltransferase [Bifidobacterium sp.]